VQKSFNNYILYMEFILDSAVSASFFCVTHFNVLCYGHYSFSPIGWRSYLLAVFSEGSVVSGRLGSAEPHRRCLPGLTSFGAEYRTTFGSLLPAYADTLTGSVSHVRRNSQCFNHLDIWDNVRVWICSWSAAMPDASRQLQRKRWREVRHGLRTATLILFCGN